MGKIQKIYDSYIDELNLLLKEKGQNATNEKIYEIQQFIYDCYQHKILIKSEYEELYIKFKECIEDLKTR